MGLKLVGEEFLDLVGQKQFLEQPLPFNPLRKPKPFEFVIVEEEIRRVDLARFTRERAMTTMRDFGGMADARRRVSSPPTASKAIDALNSLQASSKRF